MNGALRQRREATARFWRAPGLADIDLLHAEASRHRYARHSHEGYALGIVEAGAHAFQARGRLWTARFGSVVAVNPDDAHDGGPASREGRYSYRMIYVPAEIARSAVAEAAGRGAGTPFFREAVVEDAALARLLASLHCALDTPSALLERESRLLELIAMLAQRHAGAAAETRVLPPRPVAVARDLLAAHFAEELSLARLAAEAGTSRFALLRAFRRHYGLPPHAFQTQLRLRQAKALMEAGEQPAMAAAAAGFADQSHLIRKFKAAYGVTPGQYRRRRNNVQSEGQEKG